MKPSLASAHRSRRGFTLLEMLIAMAIGAIVLLAVNTTFFSALRLHNTTHARIDADLELQRALGIVRKDFAGIMLPGGVLSGQFQTSNFSSTSMDVAGGERLSPDLYTNSGKIDGWTAYSELQMVSYFLAPATDSSTSKNLVRVVTRNLLPAQEATTEEQTLLSGLTSAQFQFYDGSNWTSDWDSAATSTLPAAIKFSVVLATPDANGIPGAPIEMIVPVVVLTTASQTLAATP